MCIELNGHSLISFLPTLRLLSPNGGFHPSLLDSQSCEKAFQAACSTSSTFSTVINSGMLGLLHRLHRMNVQFCLECESQETGIRYPHLERHKVKDGHGVAIIDSVRLISDADISHAVMDSKEEAKEIMKELGMFELLQSNGDWENPPTPVLVHLKT